MPVVVIGSGADVAPFPAQVGDQIGVRRVAGDLVAAPHRVDGLLPQIGSQVLGVVVDRPEVEARAVAREVASIGGRMTAGTARHRQVHQERVEAEGRVHVEIAEQDLFRVSDAGIYLFLLTISNASKIGHSLVGPRPLQVDFNVTRAFFIRLSAWIFCSTSLIFFSVRSLISEQVVSGFTRRDRISDISFSVNPTSWACLMKRMRLPTSGENCRYPDSRRGG